MRGGGWNAEQNASPVWWRAWRQVWLRNLVQVKRELEQERYPRSGDEGLSQVAALSEMALSLGGGGRRGRRSSGTTRA